MVEEEPNAAVVTWLSNSTTFKINLPYGHELHADQPPPSGDNRGPRPTDLLLAAVGSCSAVSARSLLSKMRQPVQDLTVRATGEREKEWPRAFTKILLAFEVTVGEGSDRALIDKAVERAVRKYCPVSATIESGRDGTVIDYTITVIEAKA